MTGMPDNIDPLPPPFSYTDNSAHIINAGQQDGFKETVNKILNAPQDQPLVIKADASFFERLKDHVFQNAGEFMGVLPRDKIEAAINNAHDGKPISGVEQELFFAATAVASGHINNELLAKLGAKPDAQPDEKAQIHKEKQEKAEVRAAEARLENLMGKDWLEKWKTGAKTDEELIGLVYEKAKKDDPSITREQVAENLNELEDKVQNLDDMNPYLRQTMLLYITTNPNEEECKEVIDKANSGDVNGAFTMMKETFKDASDRDAAISAQASSKNWRGEAAQSCKLDGLWKASDIINISELSMHPEIYTAMKNNDVDAFEKCVKNSQIYINDPKQFQSYLDKARAELVYKPDAVSVDNNKEFETAIKGAHPDIYRAMSILRNQGDKMPPEIFEAIKNNDVGKIIEYGRKVNNARKEDWMPFLEKARFDLNTNNNRTSSADSSAQPPPMLSQTAPDDMAKGDVQKPEEEPEQEKQTTEQRYSALLGRYNIR